MYFVSGLSDECLGKIFHGRMSSYFAGVIHGDYNEQNLLVAKNSAKADDSPYEEHDIVGVIDFGDMAETCYVYEVMSYACLHSTISQPR